MTKKNQPRFMEKIAVGLGVMIIFTTAGIILRFCIDILMLLIFPNVTMENWLFLAILIGLAYSIGNLILNTKITDIKKSKKEK